MDVPAAVRAASEERDVADPDPDAELGDAADVDAGDELDAGDGLADRGDGLASWARRVPEGSYRDFNLGELWDPRGGGGRRVAFHVADLTDVDVSDGLPNAVGLALGLAELWYVRVQHADRDSESDAESDAESDGVPEIQGSSA